MRDAVEDADEFAFLLLLLIDSDSSGFLSSTVLLVFGLAGGMGTVNVFGL